MNTKRSLSASAMDRIERAEYSEKAAGLAADTRRLAEIKTALRDEIRASPSTDEVGFARAVAASYRAMRRRWRPSLAASD
jgi:predicted O-linked N-acetylglucosamine transferase (SPINDLY family)